MGNSLALGLYLAWSGRGGLTYANRKLQERLKEGKEDAERIAERAGEASVARPEGELIWFHAASVGESLALLELIRRIVEERDDLTVLVTTGTVTSAGVMAERLPDGAIHQYIPLDARAFVTRFLDHWRPDLAVWCESEFWPALICETHKRGVPMMIVNARMSKNEPRPLAFPPRHGSEPSGTASTGRWCRTTSRRCICAASECPPQGWK
jgi:3-deoxy-D-manno-octulosonic-acid transferase